MGEGIINIHNSHMEMWGVSVEELFSQAQVNTPRLLPWKYSTMEDILREIMNTEEGIPFEAEDTSPDKVPMRVLGNGGRVQGAACILYPGLLDKIVAREGGNFYIIPSSIHEIIILPDHGKGCPEAFKDMIVEVNRTQVAPEEVLSDSLYYYDSVRREIIIK